MFVCVCVCMTGRVAWAVGFINDNFPLMPRFSETRQRRSQQVKEDMRSLLPPAGWQADPRSSWEEQSEESHSGAGGQESEHHFCRR